LTSGFLDGDPGAPPSPATMRSILPNQSDTVTAPAEERFGLNNHKFVALG
jgi:hypothetical protein